MKRALLFLAACMLVLVPVAHAATPPGNIFRLAETVTCAGSPCSGTAPNDNADGADISQMRAITIRLCAASGQTLSGAGTLDVYAMDETDELWSLVPELEITVDPALASDRCGIVLSDRDIPIGWGRVAAVPNGVTLSSGNLTVTYVRRVKEQP
jgi:hypothetical protein